MRTKVVVIPDGDQFVLRTSNGYPIGARMLTVAPEKGKDYPQLTSRFDSRNDANRACLAWNMYILWADKKKSKSKARYAD